MPSNKSCRDGDRRQGISLQMLKRKFFSSTKSSSWKQPPSVPQLVVLTEFSFLFSVRCSLDMFLICWSYELAADNNYWVMIQVITVFCVSRLENPPSTLFSSSIEFSTMELILLYSSASIAVSQCTVVQCTQCNRVYTCTLCTPHSQITAKTWGCVTTAGCLALHLENEIFLRQISEIFFFSLWRCRISMKEMSLFSNSSNANHF